MAAITFIIDIAYYSNFPEYFNYTSGYEKFMVKAMKQFSKPEWLRNQKGSFGKYFSVPFAEILTDRGFAFTFNIMDFQKLLNSERLI